MQKLNFIRVCVLQASVCPVSPDGTRQEMTISDVFFSPGLPFLHFSLDLLSK